LPDFLALATGAAEIDLFPDLPTIFWTVVNFSLLLVGLYALLFKPLMGAVAAREDSIAATEAASAKDRKEAARVRLELDEKLDQIHAEAGLIINKATRAADEMRAQIVAEARAEATAMISEATAVIEHEKQRALAELRGEVADLAIRVAGEVIEENLDSDGQRRLAEQFIERVGRQ
jgi:F-type H+-transporting ATPase subunit b